MQGFSSHTVSLQSGIAYCINYRHCLYFICCLILPNIYFYFYNCFSFIIHNPPLLSSYVVNFCIFKKSCFVMVKHEFINIIVITILNHTLKQVEPSGFLHLSIMFPLILIFDLCRKWRVSWPWPWRDQLPCGDDQADWWGCRHCGRQLHNPFRCPL